jgi:hypothetical protein
LIANTSRLDLLCAKPNIAGHATAAYDTDRLLQGKNQRRKRSSKSRLLRGGAIWTTQRVQSDLREEQLTRSLPECKSTVPADKTMIKLVLKNGLPKCSSDAPLQRSSNRKEEKRHDVSSL